jgi:hypothetical protein
LVLLSSSAVTQYSAGNCIKLTWKDSLGVGLIELEDTCANKRDTIKVDNIFTRNNWVFRHGACIEITVNLGRDIYHFDTTIVASRAIYWVEGDTVWTRADTVIIKSKVNIPDTLTWTNTCVGDACTDSITIPVGCIVYEDIQIPYTHTVQVGDTACYLPIDLPMDSLFTALTPQEFGILKQSVSDSCIYPLDKWSWYICFYYQNGRYIANWNNTNPNAGTGLNPDTCCFYGADVMSVLSGMLNSRGKLYYHGADSIWSHYTWLGQGWQPISCDNPMAVKRVTNLRDTTVSDFRVEKKPVWTYAGYDTTVTRPCGSCNLPYFDCAPTGIKVADTTKQYIWEPTIVTDSTMHVDPCYQLYRIPDILGTNYQPAITVGTLSDSAFYRLMNTHGTGLPADPQYMAVRVYYNGCGLVAPDSTYEVYRPPYGFERRYICNWLPKDIDPCYDWLYFPKEEWLCINAWCEPRIQWNNVIGNCCPKDTTYLYECIFVDELSSIPQIILDSIKVSIPDYTCTHLYDTTYTYTYHNGDMVIVDSITTIRWRYQYDTTRILKWQDTCICKLYIRTINGVMGCDTINFKNICPEGTQPFFDGKDLIFNYACPDDMKAYSRGLVEQLSHEADSAIAALSLQVNSNYTNTVFYADSVNIVSNIVGKYATPTYVKAEIERRFGTVDRVTSGFYMGYYNQESSNINPFVFNNYPSTMSLAFQGSSGYATTDTMNVHTIYKKSTTSTAYRAFAGYKDQTTTCNVFHLPEITYTFRTATLLSNMDSAGIFVGYTAYTNALQSSKIDTNFNLGRVGIRWQWSGWGSPTYWTVENIAGQNANQKDSVVTDVAVTPATTYILKIRFVTSGIIQVSINGVVKASFVNANACMDASRMLQFQSTIWNLGSKGVPKIILGNNITFSRNN